MSAYQTVAIIPAAGTGQRMNAGVNKIWLTLDGQCILEHVLKTFQDLDLFDHIVLTANPAEIDEITGFIQQNINIQQEKVSIINGGSERQDSVMNGLRFFKNWSGWHTQKKIMLIHDAARALITAEIIRKSISTCLVYHAVGVAVPVKDTIKQTDAEGIVITTLDRSGLWAVQTPQTFDFDLIYECYEQVARLGYRFTDDCSIVEYCGCQVKLLKGSYENIKITTPEDLIIAEEILRRRINATDRSGV